MTRQNGSQKLREKKRFKQLAAKDLRWKCDPGIFAFKTTKNAKPLDGILGQQRAICAIEMGLCMGCPGFNVYVSGLSGTGKTTTIKALLDKLADRTVKPLDICYVNNFKDPSCPRVLKLPAGEGSGLKKDMKDLIEELKRCLPELFDSDEYKEKRNQIVEGYRNRQKEMFRNLEENINKENFQLVQVQVGPYTKPMIMPLIEGQQVNFDQLDSMAANGTFPPEKLKELKQKHEELNKELENSVRQARNIDRSMRAELEELQKKTGHEFLDSFIKELKDRYDHEKVHAYLDEVFEAILTNLDRFQEKEEKPQSPFPGMEMMQQPDTFSDFEVNVIVDNSETEGQPVVIENIPTHRNLFGTIERTANRFGQWTTDFTKIRAGGMLRADGGFLVFNLLDSITEPGVWKTLKRTLKTRTLEFDSYDPFSFFTPSAMKPEPIPLDVKIMAIGDNSLYFLLHQWDEDFKKIFKVKADFDTELVKDSEHIKKYASFVHKIVTDENLMHFDRSGVAALVEEGVRTAGRKKKLTTRFSYIADVIRESDHWAKQDGASLVTARHVLRAVIERLKRYSLVEEKLKERIQEKKILIDTDTEKVGQVNGLAVYNMSDYWFGLPSRITAEVSMGRAGVINIEREAKLSGKTHDKGVLIMSGYLRAKYAQDKPLTVSVSLCFEQSYGGVDGDSASSTELYATLSSLAGVPIRQYIAVTGSVNQKGEIQPIGGVNEKIEGFFDVCRERKLTGDQGVMIPQSNVDDLMLRHDVVEAVKKGLFHIYPVSTVDEGIEVLTGVSAGKRGKDGRFPAGTVNRLVDERLAELARGLKDWDNEKKKKKSKNDDKEQD